MNSIHGVQTSALRLHATTHTNTRRATSKVRFSAPSQESPLPAPTAFKLLALHGLSGVRSSIL